MGWFRDSSWTVDVIHGVLFAGLLVAVWELADLAGAKSSRAAFRSFIIMASPLSLLAIARWGRMDMPYGVYFVVLMAMWYLIKSRKWAVADSIMVFLAMAATAVGYHGWSAHTALDMVVMAAASALLLRLTPRRPLLIFMAILGVALTTVILNKNGIDDLTVTVTTGILLAGYIGGRAHREQVWADDKDRAEHDALTGTLTRHGWQRWRAKHGVESTAEWLVASFDIDDFKAINDTWGHMVGDEILQQFAGRLLSQCRDGDAAVRFGGDEFSCIAALKEIQSAESVVARLHAAVTHEPYMTAAGSVAVGVSMGYGVGALSDRLLEEADVNLLYAKRHGKNRAVGQGTAAVRNSGEHIARSELGWLADAAQGLWRHCRAGAVMTSLDGRIVAVNPAFERMAGRAAAELLGQSPAINSAGTSPETIYQEMWRNLTAGQPWQGRLQNRRPDGELWWACEDIMPIQLGGRLVGYWSLVHECADDGAAPSLLPLDGSWLDRFSLQVAFQPLVNLEGGSVIGYEALIRPSWQGDAVSPVQFFKDCARRALSVEADLACLAAAASRIEAMDRWPGPAKLFVNVQEATLAHPDRVRPYLDRMASKISRGQIVLEVYERETAMTADWDHIAASYPDVLFAQDDFGVGEADVLRMHQRRPAWLKFDRELVSRLPTDRTLQDLITMLTDWLHQCGSRVVGEGVETAEQASVLRRCGVDAGQGYFWARPAGELVDAASFAHAMALCAGQR